MMLEISLRLRTIGTKLRVGFVPQQKIYVFDFNEQKSMLRTGDFLKQKSSVFSILHVFKALIAQATN